MQTIMTTKERRMTVWAMVVAIIAAAIETDVYLPSLPDMKTYFGASDALIQWVLSANFIGLCLSSLIYGPLTDTYGRRPVVLWGLGIFLLGSIGCLVAQSIESLLLWRFIQGLGTSAAFVVPGAVIFDVYNKEEAIKAMGGLNTLIALAISTGPLIGSYLNLSFGWRANVWFVAALSLLAFLLVFFVAKESLPEKDRQILHPRKMTQDYIRVLFNAKASSLLLVICFTFGAYMTYIANLSLVFVDYFNVDEAIFAFYQGSVVVTFAVGSIFHGRLTRWLGDENIRRVGLRLLVVGALLVFLTAWIFPMATILLTLSMMLFTFGCAVMFAPIYADYMEIFPDMKGMASGWCNAVRLVFMAVIIAFSGMTFNGTMLPVGIIMLVTSLAALLCLRYALKSPITEEK